MWGAYPMRLAPRAGPLQAVPRGPVRDTLTSRRAARSRVERPGSGEARRPIRGALHEETSGPHRPNLPDAVSDRRRWKREAPTGLAVAWIGIASHTPPSVAMALRRSRTPTSSSSTGEFTVNFPSSEQASEADLFGIVSGRNADKFDSRAGRRPQAAVVAAPLITECAYNLECRVTHEIGIGEYVLVVGEIVESHAEESILGRQRRDSGRRRLRPAHLRRGLAGVSPARRQGRRRLPGRLGAP